MGQKTLARSPLSVAFERKPPLPFALEGLEATRFPVAMKPDRTIAPHLRAGPCLFCLAPRWINAIGLRPYQMEIPRARRRPSEVGL